MDGLIAAGLMILCAIMAYGIFIMHECFKRLESAIRDVGRKTGNP